MAPSAEKLAQPPSSTVALARSPKRNNRRVVDIAGAVKVVLPRVKSIAEMDETNDVMTWDRRHG
jgi:hypothetical protein